MKNCGFLQIYEGILYLISDLSLDIEQTQYNSPESDLVDTLHNKFGRSILIIQKSRGARKKLNCA